MDDAHLSKCHQPEIQENQNPGWSPKFHPSSVFVPSVLTLLAGHHCCNIGFSLGYNLGVAWILWPHFDPFGPISNTVDLFGPNLACFYSFRFLGPVWTHLDTFGPVWTHLKLFGSN